VQLVDMVLVERDLTPRGEHQLHQFGVAGYLLFISGLQGPDGQVGQQHLDFPVGEIAALDAGGRADALDGCRPAQGGQAFWRKGAQGTPCALELIDPANQAQDLRGDLKGLWSKHRTNNTPNYTQFEMQADWPLVQKDVGWRLRDSDPAALELA